MVFVADDLASWLIGVLATVGRKKLATLALGTGQQRALRSAATAAVQRTAEEACRGDDEQARHVALVIGHVFSEPVPEAVPTGHKTVLEALQAGIAAQLAVLDDADLTGTGQSSAQLLGIPGTVLAQKLTGHLLWEIVSSGVHGGPLFPLAVQLNDDMTHLQGDRVEGMIGQLAGEIRKALAPLKNAQAVAAPTALAQLPTRVAGFTGRDEELALLAGLLAPAGAAGVVVVAVAGLPGAGKTALAVAAGHAALASGWYRGGVLFIDLHGYDDRPVEPPQALDSLLRGLGVAAEHIPPTAGERAGLYRSLLAEISDPVLIIADNVASEAQARPLLPGAGPPHKVILTSRDTLAGLGARLVEVTTFDDDPAIALLDAALRAARPSDDRISGDPEAARWLARICGGLPLALQIAAAQLNADPALSTHELADELSDEKQRLERLAYDDGSGTGLSVAAAFGLSYSRLDQVKKHMFRLLPACPGLDVSTAAAAALADLTVGQARREFGGLARAHLVEAAPGTGGRWRMHDLVRLYAQRLSDEHADTDRREQAWDRLLVYYLETAGAADAHLRAVPGMAVPETFDDRDDALAWLDSERANLVATVDKAATTGRDQAALHLPVLLSEFFRWGRRFDDQIAAMATSLEAARRLGDRAAEGVALDNLGIALRQVRRFDEAIVAHEGAATVFRETRDRQDEGIALNNLSAALLAAGRFDKAIIACRDAAAIYRETGDRRREAAALGNLGIALLEACRSGEAIMALLDAAAVFRETGDRRREAAVLTNLGNALQEAGRFDEAITAHREAATAFRETGDRHSEGTAMNNLALALLKVGRPEEAISAHQQDLTICRDTGDRHGEGMALANLGTALLEAGRFDEAVIALRDAAVAYEDAGDRRRKAGALANLGTALLEAGKFDEAVIALRDAAAAHEETGGTTGSASRE